MQINEHPSMIGRYIPHGELRIVDQTEWLRTGKLSSKTIAEEVLSWVRYLLCSSVVSTNIMRGQWGCTICGEIAKTPETINHAKHCMLSRMYEIYLRFNEKTKKGAK
jgi:hypothetical protein